MMFKKQLIIYSSILATLIVLWLIGTVFADSFIPKTVTYPLLSLEDSVDIAAISIENPSRENIDLELNEIWYIKRQGSLYEANQNRVRDFLGTLRSAESTRIITENPERYGELGLNQTSTIIRFYDFQRRELEYLQEGGVAQQSNETFYKSSTFPRVLASSDNIPFFTSRESSYWTNTEVFSRPIRAEELIELQFDYDGLTTHASLQNTEADGAISWVFEQNDLSLTVDNLDGIIAAIASLNSNDIDLSNDFDESSEKRTFTITVETSTREELVIDIDVIPTLDQSNSENGSSDNPQYLVRFSIDGDLATKNAQGEAIYWKATLQSVNSFLLPMDS